ncbi:MAG: hypothetical protein EBS06_02425 [Proteobacteria bacterium]|nr:hypothetical protein [Pseudomonadota bacterium]
MKPDLSFPINKLIETNPLAGSFTDRFAAFLVNNSKRPFQTSEEDDKEAAEIISRQIEEGNLVGITKRISHINLEDNQEINKAKISFVEETWNNTRIEDKVEILLEYKDYLTLPRESEQPIGFDRNFRDEKTTEVKFPEFFKSFLQEKSPNKKEAKEYWSSLKGLEKNSLVQEYLNREDLTDNQETEISWYILESKEGEKRLLEEIEYTKSRIKGSAKSIYANTSVSELTNGILSITNAGLSKLFLGMSFVVSSAFAQGGRGTRFPTSASTESPTSQPSTANPSNFPTSNPSSNPSQNPTLVPTAPTQSPSNFPTSNPSDFPTINPSQYPSVDPTLSPTGPTVTPTISFFPTLRPTSIPTNSPIRYSLRPTGQPTSQPSATPTSQPNPYPTSFPSGNPTSKPSAFPSPEIYNPDYGKPTNEPSSVISVYENNNAFYKDNPSNDGAISGIAIGGFLALVAGIGAAEYLAPQNYKPSSLVRMARGYILRNNIEEENIEAAQL